MEEDLNNQFIIKKPTAALILENGQVFWGKGFGAETYSIGELCFNTSQTGYQEILTDPSYAKQIITFTFPHFGIVGSNENDNESRNPFASGSVGVSRGSPTSALYDQPKRSTRPVPAGIPAL